MRETISRKTLVAACCLSGLIAGACASYAPSPAAMAYELVGTHWVAESINGRAIAGPNMPQLSFGAEYRLSGSGGCNRVFGVYEAADKHIDLRGLGRTERACEAPIMAQEDAFLDVLKDADRYDRGAGRLVITAEDGRSVSFQSAAS